MLIFGSNLFGELMLPAKRDGEVVRLGRFLGYAPYRLGALVLLLALLCMGRFYCGRGGIGQAGLAGLGSLPPAVLRSLFAAVYFAATGDAADAAFALFGSGFLLLIGGSLTAPYATSTRLSPGSSGSWGRPRRSRRMTPSTCGTWPSTGPSTSGARPTCAGYAMVTVFVGDLDAFVEWAAARGR